MRPAIAGWILVASMALGANALRAQTDPRLVDAVRAAQEGQGDSARAAVQRLPDATPPSDTLYPQILYTQAMVATSAGEMRRQLQRVTVEYSTSDWADDALLRLVQMDYATRNFDGAARNLEGLHTDFPASPLMAQAAYWAGRTYFDNKNPQAACRWLADGMAQARDDVELQNRLSYSINGAIWVRIPRRLARLDGQHAAGLDRGGCRRTFAIAGTDLPHAACGRRADTDPRLAVVRTGAVRSRADRVSHPGRGRRVAEVGRRRGSKARSLGLTVVTSQQGGPTRCGWVSTRRARPPRPRRRASRPSSVAVRSSSRSPERAPCRRARCGSRSAF